MDWVELPEDGVGGPEREEVASALDVGEVLEKGEESV